MPPFERSEPGSTVLDGHGTESTDQGDLRGRMSAIQNKYREYFRITLDDLGLASEQQTNALMRWALDFNPTEAEVAEREKWYEADYKNRIVNAYSLHQEFMSVLERATNEHLISDQSRRKWIERFRDRNTDYKPKEDWVRNKMQHYITSWKKAEEDRRKLISSKNFKDLENFDPRFKILEQPDEFLNLHYEKRRGLLAEAEALLLAKEKIQLDLYAQAKTKLQTASSGRYLADGKVGLWLERIFKSNTNPKKIDEFVNGSGANSLSGLMENWMKVKNRYDGVCKKFSERWQQTGVRGFELLSESKFLSLHYAQRLRYVEQAEDRLDGANDIDNEAPVLIKLRHAMDIHDWDEAMFLVMEAKTAQLSEKEFRRLESMKSYVNQFRGSEKQELLREATEGKGKLDTLVRRVPSALQPMIVRLLHSPYANRSIHQLRWILYNNIWCRTHGYLDQERARLAASKENAERTKERAKSGLDIGRNDVLSHETGSYEYLRKEEHSKHTATVMSVNLESDTALATTEKMVETEQSPNRLYWTTLNCFTKDGPTSESWNRDLLMILTEMRSLTRTMEKSGYTYTGLNAPLLAV